MAPDGIHTGRWREMQYPEQGFSASLTTCLQQEKAKKKNEGDCPGISHHL